MLFNSFNFWVIFPLIFAVYWIVPSKYQIVKKFVLIAVSYLLYLNWKPVYALILFFITGVTFAGGKILQNETDTERKRRKLICILGAVLTLLPLAIFKYYNFVNESCIQLLEACGIHFMLPGLNWAVPIGISFYTFQALGYMWDVYYGKIKAENCFTDYVLFCSFFPQTASGPISRYSELMPQIKTPHPFNYKQGVDGLKILLWGVFLKVVIADRLGIYVNTVYSNYIHYSGLNCLVASIFYTIQIYCDFAGYSLMAVGIGKCLGFDLVNNFRRPYFATSITDFWKRWHISLTRWLTAYVYIPLGGNRCSKFRQYCNIMVTFLVSGIWHGANWTFVLWGIVHGLLQCVEKILGIAPKGKYYELIESKKWLKPIRIVVTFFLIAFAWIFFRMPTVDDAFGVIAKIMTNQSGMFQFIDNTIPVFLSLALLVGSELTEEYLYKDNRHGLLDNKYTIVRWALYVSLLTLILMYGVLDSTQFIYVSF